MPRNTKQPAKLRAHNEYFRPVNLVTVYGMAGSPYLDIDFVTADTRLAFMPPWMRRPYKTVIGYKNKKKKCENCKALLVEGESQWSWFEYAGMRHAVIQRFCIECWPEVRDKLNAHTGDCGCTVNLIGYHCELPPWMTLDVPKCDLPAIPLSAVRMQPEFNVRSSTNFPLERIE